MALCPFKISRFPKMNAVLSGEASDMKEIIQMVLQKGRRVCQLFFSSLVICGPSLFERVTCCSGQTHQLLEDKPTQVGLQALPSTILIINISNSTLTDCVIGNDSYPSAVVENQPLMQGQEHQMHERMRCNCSCGQQVAGQTIDPLPPSADPQGINIHSSHLNCVIIGDNNSMQVDQTQWMQQETGETQL